MLVSVVIRSKDEAPRLRLTLAALSRQCVPLIASGSPLPSASDLAAEVIVVDDGSIDGTAALLTAEASRLPLRSVSLQPGRGRAGASNAGAALSRGEVLLFLDGDTLPAPDLIERHAQAHREARGLFRGKPHHLRGTRHFLDPEAGTPQPGREAQVARMTPAELDRNRVTRDQILRDFSAIVRRAQPGIYPGAGPRRLFDAEMHALRHLPDLGVIWMAAAGHNLSVRRADFEAVGGFDARFMMNEHRELAYRLQQRGAPVRLVPNAHTYHLTHREGWRDPIDVEDWEQDFLDAHPDPAVPLMSLFWLSLSQDPAIPEPARIPTLAALEAVALDPGPIDYQAIRLAHPRLSPLRSPSVRPTPNLPKVPPANRVF